MRHKDIEYNVLISIDPVQRWKWTVTPPDREISGSAFTRIAAEVEAVQFIDRVSAPKKLKLIPPKEY